jgi:hypothetical protein
MAAEEMHLGSLLDDFWKVKASSVQFWCRGGRFTKDSWVMRINNGEGGGRAIFAEELYSNLKSHLTCLVRDPKHCVRRCRQ